MQKIKTFILLAITVTFCACQFNQSVNTDLITGAYSRGNGIGCDDVSIQINGKVEKRNEFVFGEKVDIVFNNISGLTNLNDKTYPAFSMHVVKNEKDTVLSNSNLLKNLNDGTDLFPLQLKANFRSSLPYKNNEKYKVYVEIWDKKGDGKFNYELPFTIKENDLLNIKNNGIEYSNIYLWNDILKQPVFDKNINSEHLFLLVLDDVGGLELNNNNVFPIFSLELIDNKGTKIISNSNLLSAYDQKGIDPQELMKNQLTAKITFTKGKINNPWQLIAKLKDKSSSKEISITAELQIN